MGKRRFLLRLYAANLMILVGSLLAVTWYASLAIDELSHQHVARDLERDAQSVGWAVAHVPFPMLAEKVDPLCKRLGKTPFNRITVILPDGKVIGDSQADPRYMADCKYRPEVKEALLGGTGVARQPTDTRGSETVHVAVPVQNNGKVFAVVRTSTFRRTLNEIDAAMRFRIVVIGIFVAAVGAGLRLILYRVASREELRALGARLSQSQEAERQRVSRDLHDQLGQLITSLGVNLHLVKAAVPPSSAPDASAPLTRAIGQVEQIGEQLREVIYDLHPPVLQEYGLEAALRWCAERLRKSADIKVHVQCDGADLRLADEIETSLLRICQEALTNVSKHACASEASIRLQKLPAVLRLTVSDDGKGFDAKTRKAPNAKMGWGLITMRERALAMGGSLRLESAPGKGTRVIVDVPR